MLNGDNCVLLLTLAVVMLVGNVVTNFVMWSTTSKLLAPSSPVGKSNKYSGNALSSNDFPLGFCSANVLLRPPVTALLDLEKTG